MRSSIVGRRLVRPSGSTDFLWSLCGTVVKAASQWSIIFILVRLAGPNQVGEYGFALSIVTPIVVTANLRLSQLQATDPRDSYSFGDYLVANWISTAFALASIIAVLLFIDMSSSMRTLTVIVGARLLAFSLLEPFTGLFTQKGRLDRYGQLLTSSYIVATLVFFWAIKSGMSLSLSFLLSGFGLILPVIVQTVPAARALMPTDAETGSGLKPTWSRTAQKRLFRLAVPMGVLLLLEALAVNVPRYVLAASVGNYELGILVGLLTLLSAGSLFVDSVVQTAIPRMASYRAEENFGQLKGVLFKIGVLAGGGTVIAGIGAWYVGPFIVELLLSPEYADYPLAIVGIVTLVGIQLITRLVTAALTVVRKIDVNMYIGAVSLALTLVMSLLLIPTYGTAGAVVALVMASVTRLLLVGAVLSRVFRTLPQAEAERDRSRDSTEVTHLQERSHA